MTFEELGAVLRSEREKKNINIDDAASQLKINPRYLRAIEDGDISILPHPAYARGFIRSYAALLGLGADETREILDNIPDMSKDKPKKAAARRPQEFEEPRSSRTGLKIFIFLCLLAAGAYYLWDAGYLDFIKDFGKTEQRQSGGLQSADSYIAAKDAEKTKRQAERQPQVEEKEPEKILPLPGSQPSAAELAPIMPAPERQVKDLPAPLAEAGRPPIANPAPSAAQAAADNAPARESADLAGPGQHKLIITAVEECWVHSNADKTDTRQFSLRKGDTFALTFADSLELKLGNAGGVRLRYDGSDLPPPGSSGQVRTLVFPLKTNS